MKNKEDSNYDFIASFYDIIIGPFLKHIRKQVVEITHVEEHDSVLEVASGTGEQAIIFTRRGTTVTGLEISNAMLKIARQKIIDWVRQFDYDFLECFVKCPKCKGTGIPLSDHEALRLAVKGMEPVINNLKWSSE